MPVTSVWFTSLLNLSLSVLHINLGGSMDVIDDVIADAFVP